MAGEAWGRVPWGTSSVVYVAKRPDGELASTAELASASPSSTSPPSHPAAKHAALGQWRATSIAGNDLLSSCLYTAGICAGYAGKMAPLSLLLVSFMLYFFRFVYGEVVTALALNGGSYTALVNITSKKVAALAACLSIISYVATAVVSALSAINYLQLLWPYINTHSAELVGTVVVLAVFAALNLLGMSESANVATGMFVTHFLALAVLMVWSLVWAIQDGWTVFRANLETDYPDGASAPLALYYGYAAAMLGITGFETAANYVEELKDGQTYIRVLRNMWWSVAVFNPVLGLLSMAVLPMEEMTNPTYSSNLLGPVALKVGGEAFQAFICVDGFLVLCGSVLTAYVGIGGLLRRLSLDRCLPDVLLARNTWRGTNHWVIIGFFAVSSSLFLVLDGDVDMLGSVYNIAFLSVMTAFAISCVTLKWKRPALPRMVVTSPFTVGAALVLVVAGLVGNIIRDPSVMAWFFLYFGAVVLVVFVMFNRTTLLKAMLRVVASALTCGEGRRRDMRRREALVRSHAAQERAAKHEAARGGGAAGIEQVIALDAPGFAGSTPVLSSLNNADGRSGSVGSADEGAGGGGFLSGLWGGGKVGGPGRAKSAEPLLLAGAGPEEDAVGDDGDEDDLARGARLATGCRGRLVRAIAAQLDAVNAVPFVFFAKAPDFETLNKAILYVKGNEQTSRLIVVHVVDDSEVVLRLREEWGRAGTTPDPSRFQQALERALPPVPVAARLLREQVALLDAVYPKLRVDFLAVRGTAFGPPVIAWLSRHLHVGTNAMFIAMPDERFRYQFAALGGVRVITRAANGAERAEREAHVLKLLSTAAEDWPPADA